MNTPMNTPDYDTPSRRMDHTEDHAGFDARTREVHAAACDALSPRVRAQLQQRRRAALAGTPPSSASRWMPAMAMAATLAVAIGLGLHLLQPQKDDAPAGAHATGAHATESSAVVAHVTGASDSGNASATDSAGSTDVVAVALSADTNPGVTLTPPAADSLDADLDAITALLAAGDTGDASDRVDMTASHASADAMLPDSSIPDDALLAALDESPDFYLWLAADDGADVEAL